MEILREDRAKRTKEKMVTLSVNFLYFISFNLIRVMLSCMRKEWWSHCYLQELNILIVVTPSFVIHQFTRA